MAMECIAPYNTTLLLLVVVVVVLVLLLYKYLQKSTFLGSKMFSLPALARDKRSEHGSLFDCIVTTV